MAAETEYLNASDLGFIIVVLPKRAVAFKGHALAWVCYESRLLMMEFLARS